MYSAEGPTSRSDAHLSRYAKALNNLARHGQPLGRPGGRGSHKWEPTQSAVPGLSPTHSECLRRSRLPVRLSPTVTDSQTALDFPDTEEVTGSNPVRPTIFSKICLAVRAKRGAGSYFGLTLPWRLKIVFMVVAPISITGRSWCNGRRSG